MQHQRHDQAFVISKSKQIDQISASAALGHQVIEKGRYAPVGGAIRQGDRNLELHRMPQRERHRLIAENILREVLEPAALVTERLHYRRLLPCSPLMDFDNRVHGAILQYDYCNNQIIEYRSDCLLL